MPLSDNEAHDRLLAARRQLGDEPAGTVRASTALAAARRALSALAAALLIASEAESETLDGVRDRDGISGPPPPS